MFTQFEFQSIMTVVMADNVSALCMFLEQTLCFGFTFLLCL